MKKEKDIVISNKFIATLIIGSLILMTYCVVIAKAMPADTTLYTKTKQTRDIHNTYKNANLKPLPIKLGGTTKTTPTPKSQTPKKITLRDWYVNHEKQRRQTLCQTPSDELRSKGQSGGGAFNLNAEIKKCQECNCPQEELGKLADMKVVEEKAIKAIPPSTK